MEANNQVVRAALVEQLEVEEGAVATTIPLEKGSEPIIARMNADQEKEEQRSGGNPKTTARKRCCSGQFTLSAPCKRELTK